MQPEAEEREEVPDLMAALEASLAAVKSDDDEPAEKPARKRTPESNGASARPAKGKRSAAAKR